MSSSHLMKLIAIAFLLSMAIVGCSPKPSEQEQEVVGCTSEETPALVDDEDPYEPTFVHEETSSDRGPLCYAPAPGGKKGDNSTVNKNKYEVRLGASPHIDKDSDGQMTVRIGLPETLQEKDSTEVYNSLFVAPADVRKYARITPRASDFILDPDTPQIVTVSPLSSTAASFSLKPKKIGVFKVSAKVEFSPTKDFSEIDGTQWTNTLSVTVEVNSPVRKKNRIEELWSVVWKYFTEFWEAFVALFFAALLFVIRKYTKKKTGYYEKPDETPKQKIPSTIKEIEEDEVDDEVSEPEASSTDIEELPESNEEEDE